MKRKIKCMENIFWKWHKNRILVSFVCLFVIIALAAIFNLWTDSYKHPIPFWISVILFIIHSIPYCVHPKVISNDFKESDKPPFNNNLTIRGFYIVPENKEFKFQALCPYCQGDLFYTCNGWEQDKNGLWMADSFDMECSTEPDMESEEWEVWMENHSDMPYVHQLPVDEKVKNYINLRYRFDVR